MPVNQMETSLNSIRATPTNIHLRTELVYGPIQIAHKNKFSYEALKATTAWLESLTVYGC